MSNRSRGLPLSFVGLVKDFRGIRGITRRGEDISSLRKEDVLNEVLICDGDRPGATGERVSVKGPSADGFLSFLRLRPAVPPVACGLSTYDEAEDAGAPSGEDLEGEGGGQDGPLTKESGAVVCNGAS
jgi:hypothetical protein